MGLIDSLRRRRRSERPERPPAPPEPPAPVEEETPPPSPPEPPRLRAANFQGVGRREGQEDSFAILNVTNPEEQEKAGLFAIMADGMGGMLDGKQASEWAVGCFTQLFRDREAGEDVPAWFYRGVHAVSEGAFRQFGGRSGTTLVAVHILENRLHWLSVGDSALFLARNGGVFQLNREHTYLNKLYVEELSRDVIDKARAEGDEDARRLTSFVGMEHPAEVDLSLRPLLLHPGDALLLCSDGVSGVLSPAELLEAMALEPGEGCALLEGMLAEKALPQQDNYTGILISLA